MPPIKPTSCLAIMPCKISLSRKIEFICISTLSLATLETKSLFPEFRSAEALASLNESGKAITQENLIWAAKLMTDRGYGVPR
jgi:hypothetical protein